MANTSIEAHFQRLKHLLELEADAEKQEALREIKGRSGEAAVAAGTSLQHLVIRDEETGLGGRVMVTLGNRNQTLELPWTRMGVGSPVLLSEEGVKEAGEGWRGVVSRVSRANIQVAFAEVPETEAKRPAFRLG